MKKAIAIIVTLVLICSLAICVVACKDKKAEDAIIGKWNAYDTTYEFYKDNTGKITYSNTGASKTFKWGLSEKSPYNTNPSGTKYYFYFDSEAADVEHYKICRGFDIMTDSDGKQYIHEIGIYGGESNKLYKVS